MNATWRTTSPPPAGPAAGAPARFDQVLARTRADNRAALATYLPAGYPNQAQSLRILHRLAEVTDVIELGWPVQFSERQNARIADDQQRCVA